MIESPEFAPLDVRIDEPWMATARNAMAQHPHLRRRQIGLRADEHQITIEGQVDSYFEKQLAQEAVRPLGRNRAIHNALVVTAS